MSSRRVAALRAQRGDSLETRGEHCRSLTRSRRFPPFAYEVSVTSLFATGETARFARRLLVAAFPLLDHGAPFHW